MNTTNAPVVCLRPFASTRNDGTKARIHLDRRQPAGDRRRRNDGRPEGERRSGTDRRIAGLALLPLLWASPAAAQPLPMGVPDLCAVSAAPTYIAAGDTVTYSGNRSATCLGVHGTLVLASNTTLTVETLLVYPDGRLLVGSPTQPAVNVQIVIADTPIDTTVDPEQYGHGIVAFGEVTMVGQARTPTFSRLAEEPTAGSTTLTLTDDLGGWTPGDRLILPDSRQLANPNWANPSAWAPQWEERTVQSVSGNVVTLTAPLAYSHPGVRDPDGALRALPHVGNLGRSIVVRSANPAGVRGHTIFINRAAVDLRYVLFKDLGRTTIAPLDSTTFTSAATHADHSAPEAAAVDHIGTNQIGRYPVHLHHNFGPAVPSASGYQFKLVGNAVEGATKWGIAIHRTSFGLVQDNVTYNTPGAAFMFEDGSETANEVVHNFAVRSFGTGGRQAEGREGGGFYFRGPLNRVRDNVAANTYSDGPDSAYGFKFFFMYLGTIRVPIGPGADTTEAGQYTLVDGNATAIREFRNNETYGGESGLTFWWVGTFGNGGARLSTPESVLDGFRVWHVFNKGVFQYESYKVTMRNLVALDEGHNAAVGYYGGDYQGYDITIVNPDIAGFNVGISPTTNTSGDNGPAAAQTIVGGILRNVTNVEIVTLFTSNHHAGSLPARQVAIDGTRFVELPGQALSAIVTRYSAVPTRNLVQDDSVSVLNYNGQPGDHFRVFYAEQAPNFVVPQTIFNTDNTPSLVGAPVGGLTNAQALAQHGVAIAGAVAPCAETRAEIVGFVCNGSTALPSVTVSSTTVNPGDPIAVTVANGPGNPTDWVALASTSAADTDYLVRRYLNGADIPPVTGLTEATLQFTAPATPGTYNFRFFATPFTMLATSNAVTVQATPTLSVNNVSLPESNDGTTTATFTATLAPTSTQTVTVNYATANGTAAAGTDYVAASGTLTFAPGVSTRPINVTVNGDKTAESNETFVVTLSSPTNAGIGTASGTGTISNDDALLPTVTVTPTTVNPGGPVTITIADGPGHLADWVTLAQTTAPVASYVTWAYLNGLATPPSTGMTAATLTLVAPATPGTYEVRFLARGGFNRLATSSAITVQAVPTLSLAPVTMTEGNSGTTTATFTATLAPASTQTVTVNYATANGTATAGSDYVAATGTLTFAPGVSSRPISVTVNGDTTAEPNETFTVTMSGPANAVLGTASATGTIANDDAAPGPTVSVGSTMVNPGSPITVTIANGPGHVADWVTLAANTSPDASYITWAYLNGLETPPSTGMTAATLTLVAPATPGTYQVRFFARGGFNRLAASSAITVQAVPTLSLAPVTVTEGNSGTTTATFTATLAPTSTQTVSVNYATANGTATAGSDYVAATGTLTFAPGVSSRPISVTVNGDTIAETNETFTVALSSPANAVLGTASAPGTILNDDAAPAPTVAVSSTMVAPGSPITVTIANGPGHPADWVALAPATAPDSLYGTWAYLNGTTTPPSTGMTAATLTLVAPATPGTYQVRFFARGGFARLATSSAITVQAQTLPTLGVNSVSVTEGNTGTRPASFTVTLSPASSQTVTVNYSTANGTATAGSDYVAANGTLIFAPGVSTRPISVVVNGDAAIEPNETFVVTLTGPTNAVLGTATATGTILNDDASPTHVNYDLVYVRAPRPDAILRPRMPDVSNPAWLDPGADLMLLHPDGSEEVLVAGGLGAVTDPFVSFDAQWVYYAYFPNLQPSRLNANRNNLPRDGSDIYRINLQTRVVQRLTHQEFTPNPAAGNWDLTNFGNGQPGSAKDTLGYGVLNLGPAPVAGGKIVFTSSRNGYTPARALTTVNMQLFVMDADGSNVQAIAPMTLGSALHPVPLKDGRIMFSSAESQGLRDSRLWGLWAIQPDGRNWEPIVSAFNPIQAFHFQTQLSNGDLVVEDYYNANNNGFGALYRLPAKTGFGSPNPQLNPPIAQTLPGINTPLRLSFSPIGIFSITPFTHSTDRPAPPGADGNPVGKLSHPSGAPANDLLVVYSPGPVNIRLTPAIDAGLYLIRGDGDGIASSPSDLVLIKNDPQYHEMWPRAVVPYVDIYGVDEPTEIPWLPNDGTVHPALPAGTRAGLVGTSSFYKRDSFPGTDRLGTYDGLDAFNPGDEQNSNWITQGADAGKYTNADIHSVRIVALAPESHHSYGPNEGVHFFNHAQERMTILGEIPLRKPGKIDPDGNPDTSLLAKIPANVPFTFQTLDAAGMVLNVSQTWHQVRPGEMRADCGGCHAHSQAPTRFEDTAAGQPGFIPTDLTTAVPTTVEFLRDIRPLLTRSCVSCHSGPTPAAQLALDDLALYQDLPGALPNQRIPGDYARLALDPTALWGIPPVNVSWRSTNASRYVRKFQSRRSLLMWKIFGQRLDGWTNGDHPTETTPGDPSTLPPGTNLNLADLDYTGTIMPPPGSGVPPLTADEKRLFATWIDLGAPLDVGALDGHPSVGWFAEPPSPESQQVTPQRAPAPDALEISLATPVRAFPSHRQTGPNGADSAESLIETGQPDDWSVPVLTAGAALGRAPFPWTPAQQPLDAEIPEGRFSLVARPRVAARRASQGPPRRGSPASRSRARSTSAAPPASTRRRA